MNDILQSLKWGLSASLLLVMLLLSACAVETPLVTPDAALPGAAQQNTNTPTTATVQDNLPTTPAVTPSAITIDTLRNATYKLPILREALPESGGEAKLSEGSFEQQFPDSAEGVNVVLVKEAFGDINGDGSEDGVGLVAVNTGGSGNFMHLVAFTANGKDLKQFEPAWLGDRTQVESIAIKDGKIILEMTVHAPDDPLCCPSLKTNPAYILTDGRLLEENQAKVSPQANAVIQVLKEQDLQSLAGFVHPEQGLRFSPYATVQENHLVFKPEQLIEQGGDPEQLNWGAWDGTGEPIEMNFTEYYQRFVYSKDFAQADQVSYDQRIGSGNSINNTEEFYLGAVVVEYYIPGKDPNYGGMDWQSLRLVFQQLDGEWFLTGIIHDEWTI